MSLEAESELLASDAGRQAAARGVYDGLVAWFGARPLAVRYDALIPGGEAGTAPAAVGGEGPPFWATDLGSAAAGEAIGLRLTNTGSEAWPAGVELLVGWSASDAPYLAEAPGVLEPLDVTVPALDAGESVLLELPLTAPVGARSIAWITLAGPDGPFTDLGSPALQLVAGG
jgi:hypothetical protein